MSEKPEEKVEHVEKAEKVEEKKAAKPAEPAVAAPAAKPAAGEIPEKKRTKISRMTLVEVETQLKTTKEKMGEFQSSFARHLLARKSELSELHSKKK